MTIDEMIEEACKYVNWNPSDKHSLKARYDALRALTRLHAYSTAVALETLRRIEPSAAERVAAHLDRDDYELAAENAWGWHEDLVSGRPIEADDPVFQKLAGRPAPNCPTCRSLFRHVRNYISNGVPCGHPWHSPEPRYMETLDEAERRGD